jgi:hypothetical protein
MNLRRVHINGYLLLAVALLVVALAYWPGLSGSWLFDDYPNIVDNPGVHPANASLPSLINAALSSPASEFKRPLASLSFAANYLIGGMDPFGWKLTNLVIHLLNGVLVFWLTRGVLVAVQVGGGGLRARALPLPSPPMRPEGIPSSGRPKEAPFSGRAGEGESRIRIVAALVAGGWMLLPINLTGVLYVVQRMESLANLFVLLGLIGYVSGRQHMLANPRLALSADKAGPRRSSFLDRGFLLCLISLCVPTALGLLAKETAVMLPLYAWLVEWALFRFLAPKVPAHGSPLDGERKDRRLITLFVLVLALPMILGLGWMLSTLLNPAAWATRDFTLGTRLLSEARIVIDYIGWTLLPIPQALSFYHDDFVISSGLLTPWTTLASMLALAGLLALMIWLHRRQPLAALGIALFLGCHLLTGTILPLELIYEHRNYFASFGLLLALVPLLVLDAAPGTFALPRRTLLTCLLLWWTTNTAITAHAWGNPLSLAEELAERAPESPRAQYELGRTYIIYSHYNPASPFTKLAYAPLERAAGLPNSSILPQQALIFMNSRMHLSLKDAWWESMTAKLKARRPGVQDESSLAALVQCARAANCDLPKPRMLAALEAARGHPQPSARLLATYGDYAWSVLGNQHLGEQLTAQAVQGAPNEPAYRITLVRMLLAMNQPSAVPAQMRALSGMNVGARLDSLIKPLQQQIDAAHSSGPAASAR